jgi:hypothetical protein
LGAAFGNEQVDGFESEDVIDASAWIAYHGNPFGSAREPLPFFAVFVLEHIVVYGFGEADASVGPEIFRIVREGSAVGCHCVGVNFRCRSFCHWGCR